MMLWIVAANCGDYYCGCGVGHVLGVYTSKDNAEAAAVAAREQQHFYRERVTGRPREEWPPREPRKSWDDVWVVEGETDGPVPAPIVDGHAPEWGTIVSTARPPIKIQTLVCPLCGNHDDRKPPKLYAGETCVCCSKGRLVEVEETYAVLPEEAR